MLSESIYDQTKSRISTKASPRDDLLTSMGKYDYLKSGMIGGIENDGSKLPSLSHVRKKRKDPRKMFSYSRYLSFYWKYPRSHFKGVKRLSSSRIQPRDLDDEPIPIHGTHH